jgi:hypothetical protein
MNTKRNFSEMVAYDFSNLNLGQNGNDNCYTCDNCNTCNHNPDGSGCNDCNNCDTCEKND